MGKLHGQKLQLGMILFWSTCVILKEASKQLQVVTTLVDKLPIYFTTMKNSAKAHWMKRFQIKSCLLDGLELSITQHIDDEARFGFRQAPNLRSCDVISVPPLVPFSLCLGWLFVAIFRQSQYGLNLSFWPRR